MTVNIFKISDTNYDIESMYISFVNYKVGRDGYNRIKFILGCDTRLKATKLNLIYLNCSFLINSAYIKIQKNIKLENFSQQAGRSGSHL